MSELTAAGGAEGASPDRVAFVPPGPSPEERWYWEQRMEVARRAHDDYERWWASLTDEQRAAVRAKQAAERATTEDANRRSEEAQRRAVERALAEQAALSDDLYLEGVAVGQIASSERSASGAQLARAMVEVTRGMAARDLSGFFVVGDAPEQRDRRGRGYRSDLFLTPGGVLLEGTRTRWGGLRKTTLRLADHRYEPDEVTQLLRHGWKHHRSLNQLGSI